MDGLQIRPLEPGDTIDELTDLLHRAYAPLAEAGFRFLATHQDAQTTTRRSADGECHVAVLDGRIVGTITFCEAARTGGSPWYDRADVASFQQFGVEPTLGRRGIGSALMDLVERRARETGAAEIACDTAEGATHLVEMYERRGFRVVEQIDWRPVTNYRSVVLSKSLG